MRKMMLIAFTAVTFSGLAVTSGCSLPPDKICSDGEYPAMVVGDMSGSGTACFKNGQEPTPPYARYPKGKVPQHVGDTWDIYWQSHTIDKDGNIVKIG